MRRLKVKRIPERERAAMRAEEMRSSLPLGMYLGMLHEAAVTGSLPELTKDGERTGNNAPVAPLERIRLLQYLTDKAMPAPAHPNETQNAAPTALDNLTADQIRNLSLGELQRLLAPTPRTPQQQESPDVRTSDATDS